MVELKTARTNGGFIMTYADFFSEIKGKFLEADVSDITEHLAYQFNIIEIGRAHV